MAEHEPCIGRSDDWYTPRDMLEALGESFDLDPCSPGVNHWVPANRVFTKADDGLAQEWDGFVFMNPPFGGRNGHVPWLEKFLAHGNGIAIVRAYTSAAWFHKYAICADAMLFPLGKTKFVRPDGTVGGSPGHGIVLLAMGERGKSSLRRSGLGLFVDLEACRG
ncbi:phage N-6-adenine-methyltransferase [Pseudomonas aeruginosa]|uniref:DNA N-6-adenine-methyltransferase n=1 Tax=Pseudomonas aeruginosa TaxID=287 RepID=UPI0029BFE134|nr:DNA N-6-adenine-methyltransferase [Pseudomonas aeruginosa]MCS7522264.1 phage N-6-adenine-methyltransferase [Pseudomonas aeruginosa]MCS7615945.1 phage N-6-adenine-methyltransferase [Pseudomonas aeruginosa]MCS9911543.1 phage N-6-adenine-methyltransferase [Pseudomonas aeruginosa]